MNEKIVVVIKDTPAFKEGFEAATKSILIELGKNLSNPYPKGTPQWEDWICGFNSFAFHL